MAVLKILTTPDPRLKQISAPISQVDSEIQTLMHNLLETAKNEGGDLGLAAPQVGVLKRVIMVDVSEYDEIERPKGFYPLFMANPTILEKSDTEISEEEGCFSVPQVGVKVPRAEEIKVEYLDYNNNKQILDAKGLLARVIQHEIDHLNGILTIDYLTPLKRDVAERKLLKLKRAYK